MGWRSIWGKALTERTYVIAAAAIVGAVAIGLIIWAVSGGDNDAAADTSTETAGVGTERDDELGAGGEVVSDEDSSGEESSDGEESSGTSGGDDDRDSGEIGTLGAAADDASVDDEMAVTMYCTIDTERIAGMPRSADGEVDEEALRGAVLSLSDQHDEWRFAAYGRPGFEELLEPVSVIEHSWQQAVDAYDASDSGAAESAIDEADAALTELRDRLDDAGVECA